MSKVAVGFLLPKKRQLFYGLHSLLMSFEFVIANNDQTLSYSQDTL